MLVTSLRRGLTAGLVAGLAFGLFVALVANPLIGVAEAMADESAIDDHAGHADGAGAGHATGDGPDAHAAGADHGHESAVAAATTRLVSVAGGVGWGLFLGSLFGLAFYVLEPVLPGVGDTQSLLLAGGGFLTASGIPWLVLPPVAPGVESALPTRLGLLVYGGMVLLGGTLCIGALFVYDRLRARRSRPAAIAAAIAPFGVLVVPVLLAPGASAADTAPAGLAPAYRGIVIVGQLGLWGVLGTAHGWLRRRETAGVGVSGGPSSRTARPPAAD